MSAEPVASRCLAALIALIGSTAAPLSWAQPIDELQIFDDPLHTTPARLDSGTTLPGDNVPVTCPMRFDVHQALTLDEAVDLALCNNPRIQSAWAAIKLQTGTLGQARAAYLPTLQATVSRVYSQTSYPGNDLPAASNSGTTIYGGLSWRLFDFGGRAANVGMAREYLAAALASHDATLQSTLNDVIGAYFDALTAQATLDARQNAVKVAQATLDSAERREAKGAAPHSDTLQAETALAKASLTQSRANGRLRKSLAVLVNTLGLPSDTGLYLPPQLDAGETQTQTEALQAWLDTAKQHPAIQAARLQWEASKRNVDAAKSEGLPTVDLTANRYNNGYPNQGLQPNHTHINTVGVALTVPLFDGFSRGYKIMSAQAQVNQKVAQLHETEHQIFRDVIKAHAEATTSARNLSESQKLLEAAKAAQTTSQRRYEKGAADIVEVLTSHAALIDAMLERVQCISDWQTSQLQLIASVGQLGHNGLIQHHE